MGEQVQNLTPWQKTKAGKIFISILLLLLLLLLAFGFFVGYYVFKIKTGGGEELAQQFYQEFSKDPSLPQDGQSEKIFYNTSPYVRENNPIMGTQDAPVIIMMFVDFECPSCKKAFPIIKQITEKYSPVVKIVFKHFPLSSIHPNAEQAALAATCAYEQNKFWEYYDLLFQNGKLDGESLLNYAQQLGLQTEEFSLCMASEKTTATVNQDQYDGLELGVQGTPTYFINGNKIEGVVPLENWGDIILNQLGN